jgi:hypothetical protein
MSSNISPRPSELPSATRTRLKKTPDPHKPSHQLSRNLTRNPIRSIHNNEPTKSSQSLSTQALVKSTRIKQDDSLSPPAGAISTFLFCTTTIATLSSQNRSNRENKKNYYGPTNSSPSTSENEASPQPSSASTTNAPRP